MHKEVWLSRRALRLHAVVLIVVPAFMALCLWQLSRALGGNELSWAYVFEWPLFAAYAIYMWWRFVHEAPEDAAPPVDGTGAELTANGDPAAAHQAADTERRASEDAELAAYNDYLAQLAQRDQVALRDPGRPQAEKHIS
jgi:DNA-binding transcriptional regulator of glucitol operon